MADGYVYNVVLASAVCDDIGVAGSGDACNRFVMDIGY